MSFQIKTEFDSVEAAIAYLKGDITSEIRRLEAAEGELTSEKGKLIGKRDELLGELKTVKTKYEKFKGHEDIDIEELKRKAEAAAGDESEVEAKYRKAYEADQKKFSERLAALEKEREAEKQQAETEKKQRAQAQLRADAIAEFSKAQHHIISPTQFWNLYGQGKVQIGEDSKPFAEVDYKKMSIPEYVRYLAEDPENQHHFKPSGHSGSGAGQGSSGSGKKKTWQEMTLTEKSKLMKENPELGKQLASGSL